MTSKTAKIERFLQSEYEGLVAVDGTHELCALYERLNDPSFMDEIRARFPNTHQIDHISLMQFANAMENAKCGED